MGGWSLLRLDRMKMVAGNTRLGSIDQNIIFFNEMTNGRTEDHSRTKHVIKPRPSILEQNYRTTRDQIDERSMSAC